MRIFLLFLYKKLAREIRKSFMAFIGDAKGFAALKAPIVHPHTQDHMKRHIRR